MTDQVNEFIAKLINIVFWSIWVVFIIMGLIYELDSTTIGKLLAGAVWGIIVLPPTFLLKRLIFGRW